MTTGVGFGGGGGFCCEFGGGEDEFPDAGAVLLPWAGALELELPPQPVSARATIASDASNVVLAFPFFIVLTPLRPRGIAVTEWGKHQLFLGR